MSGRRTPAGDCPGPPSTTLRGAGDTGGLVLPFGPESASIARDHLAGWLHTHVDDADHADARLVVSELVGNAVRHGRPLADGTMQVEWQRDGERHLDIAVTDGGSGRVPELQAPEPGAASGRGLAIVESVSTSWWVDRDDRATTVHARLILGPVSA